MKAPTQGQATLASVQAVHSKQYGDKACVSGTDLLHNPPRLPLGIFPLDYAIGGGIPIYCATQILGKEQGGKTSVAANAMAVMPHFCWRCFSTQCTCSQPSIIQKTYFSDVEGTLNKSWLRNIGVPDDSYYYALADNAETYIDMFLTAMRATDCGLAIMDSVAALTPEKYMEGVATDEHVGLQPRIITKFIQKVRQRLIREERKGHPMAVILNNQIRFKIGVIYGSPENIPGGQALRHESPLWIRIVPKAPSPSDTAKFKDYKEYIQRHAFSIPRSKVDLLAFSGEFLRVKANIPELGIRKGEVLDYGVMMKYAKDYGIMRKEGNAWVFDGLLDKPEKAKEKVQRLMMFSKQDDIAAILRQDRGLFTRLGQTVIHKAMAQDCIKAKDRKKDDEE
jgi:recombination protein RecA